MQNETPTTLPSANEARGFFGTIRHHAEPREAWAIAMEAVAIITGCSDEAVRDFLDSRYGRHFADEVADGLVNGQALPAAIERRDRALDGLANRRSDRTRAGDPARPALSHRLRGHARRPARHQVLST